MHLIHNLVRVIERSSAEHAVVCSELPLKDQVGWRVLWNEMADTVSPRQAIRDQQIVQTATDFGSNALAMLNTQEDMVVLQPVMNMIHSSNARSIVKPSSEIVHLRMVANDPGTLVPFVAEVYEEDIPVVDIRRSNVLRFRSAA